MSLQDLGGESPWVSVTIDRVESTSICVWYGPAHSTIATAHAIVCVRTLALMECHSLCALEWNVHEMYTGLECA